MSTQDCHTELLCTSFGFLVDAVADSQLAESDDLYSSLTAVLVISCVCVCVLLRPTRITRQCVEDADKNTPVIPSILGELGLGSDRLGLTL